MHKIKTRELCKKIYWTTFLKNTFQKNSFKEISKDFIKSNFELIISIYLFTKKSQFILFKWFDSISFIFYFQKGLFTLIVSKEFITKFQFGDKNHFYLFLLSRNEFL